MACMFLSKGMAFLFGINIRDNFKRPYLACPIQEFWRRWHMSLSEWLRDYIYIPLGGSRRGNILQYRNLILTFVVSGIWHGTGYRFIVWGMLYACY